MPLNDNERQQQPQQQQQQQDMPSWTSLPLVNRELNSIIPMFLRDFVQSWYNHLTPDTDYLNELNKEMHYLTQQAEKCLQRVRICDGLGACWLSIE